jgi:ribose transport system ATP-binding protein
MTAPPYLEFRHVCKRFGATQALQDVSLSVQGGETLALIGENGAGKSTLMKLLSGVHKLDEGSMLLSGASFTPSRPTDSLRSGIAMIYQELNLAKHLTVEENIMLGQEDHLLGWVHRSTHRKKVQDVLELLGHQELEPTRVVGSLSVGAQQLVEIARALVARPRVMIFDEPTSSLPSQDVDRLFAIIERLKQQGMAIIYISHMLEEIRRVAKRFVVLRDGRTVATGTLDQTSDDQIVSMMAGRSVETLFPKVEHSLGAVQLSVRGLTGKSNPSDVSFDVHEGEIFGLFGLVGAGRTETLRHLFGLDRSERGTVTWRGSSMKPSPRVAILQGLGISAFALASCGGSRLDESPVG